MRSMFHLDLSYLSNLAPLIVCIPAATSYVIDKKSGFLNYIFIKLKKKEYFKIRFAVNALIGGLTILIPETVMLIFMVIRHGINNKHLPDIGGAFGGIYQISKPSYAVIILIMTFIFGIVFSTFALGISAIVENKYLTILLPYVYVIISGTIFEVIGFNKFAYLNVVVLFNISCKGDLTSINVILYDIALMFISSVLFFYFGKKNNNV